MFESRLDQANNFFVVDMMRLNATITVATCLMMLCIVLFLCGKVVIQQNF